MKIRDVQVFVLSTPLNQDERFTWAQGQVSSRGTTIVEIFTDEGVSGFGEAFGFSPMAIKAQIEHFYKPLLIGENALDTNRLWDLLYTKSRMDGQKGIAIQALSGIDLALWDIRGKRYGAPISMLLGGSYRDRVRTYPTGFFRRDVPDPQRAWIDEAGGYVAQGYGAMKLKLGFGLKEDVEKVRVIREAVGPTPLLMVDANCAYNAAEAIWLAKKIEPYDIFWFEEPVPPEDLEGHLEFKRRTSMLLAAGESEFTRYGFRVLISNRAVDILQPDLCSAGGFSEMLKILALATAWDIRCIPHVWGSAVGLAANLQLQAALPHFPMCLLPEDSLIEYDRSPNPLREELIEESFEMDGTKIIIPTGPGLGVTLNRAALQKYRIA